MGGESLIWGSSTRTRLRPRNAQSRPYNRGWVASGDVAPFYFMNIQQQRRQVAIESILRNPVYLPESALYKLAHKSLGKLSTNELVALVFILGMKTPRDFIRGTVPKHLTS